MTIVVVHKYTHMKNGFVAWKDVVKQLGSVRTNQAGSPRTPSDDKVASKDAMAQSITFTIGLLCWEEASVEQLLYLLHIFFQPGCCRMTVSVGIYYGILYSSAWKGNFWCTEAWRFINCTLVLDSVYSLSLMLKLSHATRLLSMSLSLSSVTSDGLNDFKSRSFIICVNIVVLGIPSSKDRFRSDFLGDCSTDAFTSAHVSLRVEGRPVLGLSLIDPVRNSLCSHRSIVLFGGAGLPNLAVKSWRTSSMVLPECTRSCVHTLASSLSSKL